ncbi:MAG: dTDP-4-dehydrorhamnose 3,5-epimerase [Sedimentisphaerales bacterium]|jgi:dTDP-4-dehydrorhamnose 3,5-epimerase
MKITKAKLAEVLIIEPDVFDDERGWFLETFSDSRYKQAGIKLPFVQDNVSFSAKNILRGLHFQYPHSQGKLVQVLSGEVFDVAVDIRVGSPAFGLWVGETLSASSHKQIYIPPGFAHGFCVLSDAALFSYKCTDYYSPADETGIIFNDQDLNIAWPVASPVVLKKDAGFPRLKDIPRNKLPQFREGK